ncbi:MAG: PASTA domain-containing protein, partial [Bacteroidales bacterium]|nr:PASTA domain-containing protein [Bacteroidales bacterium]
GSNGNYTESYNYAIGASTEPGSTFKLPVLMAALEDGLIDTAEIIDTKNGVVTYYNKAVRDSKAGGYGKITVKQVFEKSSNVGTSLIITNCYKDNPQAFVNRLYSFGLNEKNGISLAGEGEPIIRYPGDKLWSGLSLPQMSYGYEVQMTPLQILTFYNAVANDGKMMRPRFVSAISRNGKVIKQFPSEVIKDRIASTETINKAKSMMEGVVERGTGTNLRAADYKIAGKTGTAQIANDNKGYKTTSRMLYQASFVGYFPADKPLYSCIVVVSAPSNGVYYGNVVAGSVFKEISDKLYATHFYKDQQQDHINYSVAPAGGYVDDVNTVLKKISANYNKVQESDWVTTSFANDTVTLSPVSLVSECVPDVRGMTLRDAIYLLENAGYRVRYSGRGRVRKQSPSQGSKFYTGQIVSIELGV